MSGLFTGCRLVATVLVLAGLGGCEGRPEAVRDASTAIDPSGHATACYVYVQGDCHGWVPAVVWFYDDYNGASSSEGACLHRAREYAAWCGLGSPDDQVNAAFNLGSVTIGAQVFKPGFDFGAVDPRVITLDRKSVV